MTKLLFIKIAFTGAIVLALELVASRILTPFFGVSLNVWASILSVTLIALAIGYKFGGYISNKLKANYLVLYFISSGALAGVWLNIALYTYPQVLIYLSTLGFVTGTILSCFYIMFIPLVIYSSLNTVLVSIISIQRDTSSVESKDHKTGSILFVSTVGSVLGVFITAYIILNIFSNYVSYAIISTASSFASLALCATVNNLTKKNKIIIISASILLIFMSANVIIKGEQWHNLTYIDKEKNEWKVVSRVPSYYGNHTIVDFKSVKGFEWRGLLTSGLINNKMTEKGKGNSYSPYSYVFEALSFSSYIKPKTALVLGLGVGIVPRFLANNGVDVQVVDIDKATLKIAKKYFSLDDSKLKINISDARTFIRECPQTYDVVFVDIFQGDGIPSHVVSSEFFNDIKDCMNDNAIFLMNSFYGEVILTSKKSLFKTLTHTFGNIIVFEEPTKPNQIFTQGYIMARKAKSGWDYSVSLEKTPKFVRSKLIGILKNSTVYTPEDAFFQDSYIIRDGLNSWKTDTAHIDTIFRKRLTSHIPWQVLID